MSKVSVYVLCTDGLWYRNPVWSGEAQGFKWFLCFGDEFGGELVSEVGVNSHNLLAELARAGIHLKVASTATNASVLVEGVSKPASVVFVDTIKRPFRPNKPIRGVRHPGGECVLFDFANGKRPALTFRLP
jgi:hypothetical protein